jgi:hypothetical protein
VTGPGRNYEDTINCPPRIRSGSVYKPKYGRERQMDWICEKGSRAMCERPPRWSFQFRAKWILRARNGGFMLAERSFSSRTRPRMSRIRHCVECPNCRTRYLLSFRRYGNGAYLVSTLIGSVEEYALYCSCTGAGVVRWKSRETKACQVSKEAFDRGYRSPEEIFPISEVPKSPRQFHISAYSGDWGSIGRRKQSY